MKKTEDRRPKRTRLINLSTDSDQVHGDQRTGYFDARLAYTRGELPSKDEEFLRTVVGSRDVELLYDEFDSAEDGERWIHRLLFWPYQEVSIEFADLQFGGYGGLSSL